ncbi:MAG: hypothetical protein JRI92_06050 [Deltaproteobacteria bacterium]|nr:hypothetical protein [Deltaproteobacteria bacterium]
MKKVILSFVMILFLCAPAFGQVETVATETLKAYQNRDAEKLKKHVAGFFKTLINDKFFDGRKVQKYMKAIENWDGKFKEIRYGAGNMMGKQMYTALAYYADAPGNDKIYAVALSSTDKKKWMLVADGLVKEKREEFEKFSAALPSGKKMKTAAASKKFSIEMANGDTFDTVSPQKIKESINQLDDDNFFLILKNKDDFIQTAYSDKGYDVQYKENGAQFSARDFLSKNQAISAFVSYYNGKSDWKNLTPWDKMD